MLRDHNYDVVAVAPPDDYSDLLVKLGCRFIPIEMAARGRSILQDLRLFVSLLKILSDRPIVFCGFTIKPNIYGSLAAHILGVPVINNIAGRGAVFSSRGALLRIVLLLYRVALGRSHHVFFQNKEDRDFFVLSGLAAADRVSILPGSGVDVEHFAIAPVSKTTQRGEAVFLLFGRLLWEKGIRDFVAAARQIKAIYPRARFQLLGFLGEAHLGYVDRDSLAEWTQAGEIEYLGESIDVRPFIESATCIVLPSFYHEGTPRSLLEAAAMGRPIITTDTPGCRDVVEDGVSGYLIPSKDPDSLRLQMVKVLAMNPEEIQAMGRAARNRIETIFDERIIQGRYQEEIQSLLPLQATDQRR